MGKWGHFSDDGKEYIVTRPDTPRPWINYLTNGHYCAICSHTGGGYSFVGDPGYNRITREHPGDEIFEDRPGRYIFVHELETGKIWSLTWQPVLTPHQGFEARIGLGYTSVKCITHNVESNVTYFVPNDEDLELWMVSLTNHTKHKRTLRIYTYVELTLGDFKSDIIDRSFVNLFNKTWFEKNILFATKTRWTNPVGDIRPWNRTAFITMNIPVDGYESMREHFLGEYQYLSTPATVKAGTMPHHTGDSMDAVGVVAADIVLDAHESVTFDVLMGAVEKEQEAHALRSKYSSHNAVEASFNHLQKKWDEYNDHVVVKTPNRDFNTSVNTWNRYQCWVTSQWSEMDSYYIAGSGVYGFRDECQHIFGVLPHDSQLAKSKLSDLLSHQLKNGMTVHNWDAYSKKGVITHHSDDPQWLAMSIMNYIKETGDIAYLNERYPYYDGESGEVYSHLIKAIDYTLVRSSNRGIPLRLTADWNDALGGSEKGSGESVMVAAQVCWNIQELIPILEARNDFEAVKHYQEHYHRLMDAINKDLWDGKWYTRATTDAGENLGSHTNKEGMIFLNAQSWPIIAGVADYDPKNKSGINHTSYARGKEAMDAVWKKLMTPYGPTIFLPPYTAKNTKLGIIAQFTPGTKENGTIFLHPVSWSVIAECILGRGDKAFEIWHRSSFISRSKDSKYKSEPYVYPEYMYGPAHPKYGQGSYTWITGSAAWFYRASTDWILGVRPTLKGLIIDPCIPSDWHGFTFERDFRDARYQITVKNPSKLSKGVQRIIVDGKEIAGNLIPDFKDKKTHSVEVVLEK